MNVVVVDEVLTIHILRPRAISAKQNAGAAKLLNVVSRNGILLRVEIQADRAAAAVGEVALLDRAVLSAPEADQGIRFIKHLPIVLKPGVIDRDLIPLTMHKGEATKAQVADGEILGPLHIDLSFHADVLRQLRRFHRRLVSRPELEFTLLRIQSPLARFIEFLKHVFDPAGRRRFEKMKRVHGISGIDRSPGHLLLLIHRE